ncbi:MAG: sulfite oxidase-like oxidoreductase, partial [Desulfatiglandales bacterium]|nr:sulfite oxidase-like oxidoreductase [Desulfatiglandales bacterium]
MPYDPNSKAITGREKLAQYRKAIQDKQKWEGPLPQGEGPPNRDGNPKIPPGQQVVENWPVLDLGVQPKIELEDWSLTISGLVKNPKMFSWKEFMAFSQVDDVSDFHCVTTWSRLDNNWRGVRFSDIANYCELLPGVKYVYIKAYDAYSTNLPLEEAMKYDVLLVHRWEGQPLTTEHGGPVRMIAPQLYAWKGAKWIGEIEFRDYDELGYWEQRGYSNTAEPWLNDR